MRGRAMKKTQVPTGRSIEGVLAELWRKVVRKILNALQLKVRGDSIASIWIGLIGSYRDLQDVIVPTSRCAQPASSPISPSTLPTFIAKAPRRPLSVSLTITSPPIHPRSELYSTHVGNYLPRPSWKRSCL